MNKIFWGFLLIFLDFNLTINTSVIGLLPDFVGYIILIKGLNEVIHLSDNFNKAKSFAIGMSAYSGVIYCVDLFGLSMSIQNYLHLIIGLAATIISIYISYLVVAGVQDIELTHSCDLNYAQLYTCWKLSLIFSIATYILFFIPLLAILSVFAAFIVEICFLVAFNKTRNLFNYKQF